ncbi:phospholipid carrier-dependent glycosyltransferase [Siphonobacter aquaeclarae]|uniref:ArnT-like N-terminal domain-containing protein n=1 Tax=Siphonobacter aquaeclarae TaxID=563176 RepID=A0A1G9PS38_9BACT|nr:phospholipid carrier-dependent glycosyltransferase [Siphonobacter aquaeclarae]SDM01483.1 Protein of unknown function [Siphonobacter aquaeclarae]
MLFGIALLYFVSAAGINCSNDGSHVALAKAIYNDQDVRIEKYFHYVACCDFVQKDGRILSDRLPGNALLMQPFLAFSALAQYLGIPSLRQEPDVVAIHLLPVLCGVLTVLLLFLLFRRTGFSPEVSLISSLVYAVCTQQWLEATHAFSHAPSALFVLAAVYAILPVRDPFSQRKEVFVSMALLGFATLLELQNILFVPIVALYACRIAPRRLFSREGLSLVSISAWILLFFVGILMTYNYIAFHELMIKTNTYNHNFPEERSFSASLSGNFAAGMDRLFTNLGRIRTYYDWVGGSGNETPGLLAASPVMLISFWGFRDFFRRLPAQAWLFLAFIVISVLIAAFHKTTLTRHIFTVTPFLFFPFAYIAERLLAKPDWRLAPVFLLVVLSFLRSFYIGATYWGHGRGDLLAFRTEIAYFLLLFIPLLLLARVWSRNRLSAL